jgi:hypothetical protein
MLEVEDQRLMELDTRTKMWWGQGEAVWEDVEGLEE